MNPIIYSDNSIIVRLETMDGSPVYVRLNRLPDAYSGRSIDLSDTAMELIQGILLNNYDNDSSHRIRASHNF
mgnify:CR=1 FL=1|jgi:hypothetical protein